MNSAAESTAFAVDELRGFERHIEAATEEWTKSVRKNEAGKWQIWRNLDENAPTYPTKKAAVADVRNQLMAQERAAGQVPEDWAARDDLYGQFEHELESAVSEDVNKRVTAETEGLDAASREEPVAEAMPGPSSVPPSLGTTAPVPKTHWDEDVHEWFADQMVAWVRTGEAPTPQLRSLFEYYAQYLKRSTTYNNVLSPEVKSILGEIAQRPVTRAAPFDTDSAALFAHAWGAANRSQRRAKDLVYFKTNRSWVERSLNHPYFGLYPLSYMWGKVLPDVMQFLMFKPFGFEAPMAAMNVAYRVYHQTMQQMAYDENTQKFMADNEPYIRALSMFIPGLPWELPVNAPAYVRRITEALATQDLQHAEGRTHRDGSPINVDPFALDYEKITGDTLSYAFGPTAGIGSLVDSVTGAGALAAAAAGGVLHSTSNPDTPMLLEQGQPDSTERVQPYQGQGQQQGVITQPGPTVAAMRDVFDGLRQPLEEELSNQAP